MELKLCSKENEFIFSFGVNKGYQNSTQKIDRCYFLSDKAKQLYRNICHYAYGDKRDCFPGQVSLRDELDWSKGTISTYLNELISLGFIQTVNHGANKPLTYSIVELCNIPLLYHSEMIHKIRLTLNIEGEIWIKLKKLYAQSPLYDEITQSADPLSFYKQVLKWFEDSKLNLIPVEGVVVVKDTPQIPSDAIRRFKNLGVSPKVDEVGNFESKQPRKKRSTKYIEKATNEWNSWDFFDYYSDKFNEKTGLPYLGTKADDSTFMSTVIKKFRNNEHVKVLIDLYLDHPEIANPQNIQNFSASWVQQKLQALTMKDKKRITSDNDNCGFEE